MKGPPRTKDERPVEQILAELAARALVAQGDPAAAGDLLAAAQAHQGARRAEELAKGSIPGPTVTLCVHQPKLNRKLRKLEQRALKVSEAIARIEQRAHQEGDAHFQVTEFPWLDFRIRAETWKILRDVSGKAARIFAAALPPGQALKLIEAARELEAEGGYASVRWRELAAAAWASWRLSRPVRARSQTKDSPEKRLGDYALGLLPPEPEAIAPPVKRVNPWKGGRVVEGYARQAFALLLLDTGTGKPRSVSSIFYTNGSGQLGPVASVSQKGLGLFTRVQPPAERTTFKGPKRKNPKTGQSEPWALGQHWYSAAMCGRRTATSARRGQDHARGVLRELVPWLFEDAPAAGELADEAQARESAVGGTAPSAGAEPVQSPSPELPEPAPPD
ncbi:MAG: hypothetical protein IT378_24005 [Sandaracinaceae bacterium]|nr:hypothetical protein [Sandaracinaceae bacterium]